MSNTSEIKNRRTINSRNTRWANWLAKSCFKLNITPNQISIASIFFAALAGLTLYYNSSNNSSLVNNILLLLSIVFIQLRLICNLIDGMVAIEHKLASKVGALYNEVPDRVADTLIILGLCFSLVDYPYLTLLTSLLPSLAIATAYIRVLGGSCGLEQRFLGPMAKQHRMALICIACLLAILLPTYNGLILYSCLWLLLIGCTITIIRRLYYIAQQLNNS